MFNGNSKLELKDFLKKKTIISLIAFALCVTALAFLNTGSRVSDDISYETGKYVYDGANIISDTNEAVMNDVAVEIANKNDVDLFVVTDDTNKSAQGSYNSNIGGNSQTTYVNSVKNYFDRKTKKDFVVMVVYTNSPACFIVQSDAMDSVMSDKLIKNIRNNNFNPTSKAEYESATINTFNALSGKITSPSDSWGQFNVLAFVLYSVVILISMTIAVVIMKIFMKRMKADSDAEEERGEKLQDEYDDKYLEDEDMRADIERERAEEAVCEDGEDSE